MIEVEKKFTLTKESEAKLIEGAEFLGKKEFTDTYYDDPAWSLTLEDKWLRSRNNKFELKVGFYPTGEKHKAQYNELVTDEEIAAELGLPTDKPLAEAILTKNYTPFARFDNVRRKYLKDGFTIDIDIADFGDFTHSVCEIERIAQTKEEVPTLINQIITFGEQHGLVNNESRSKLIEYIRRKRPDHYHALVLSGKVWDEEELKK